MTTQQKYEHWLDIAQYDLETAASMLCYPDFISKLSSQIKEKEAKEILAETKEVFAWLLTLKP